MTRVYFVRHAQPEHGWEDDRTRPLTDDGKRDSAIVTEFLCDKNIDVFYSSPYKRSMDTIAHAAEYYNKQIITDERLREREKGENGNVFGMFRKRWADHDYHEEGGESISMVRTRNIAALTDILKNNADKNIVVGTHGTALSSILNFYDNNFGCDDFLRIIDFMPYIIELDFESEELVGKTEHCYIEKEFKGKERADKKQGNNMNFDAFVDDIKKNNWNVFGAEVYVDGKLAHSYGDTNGRYPIYSATKTITAIAAGIAADEGKLDINKSILEYLPENTVTAMSEEQLRVYEHITTKRLMTMSVVGYPFRPSGELSIDEVFKYPITDVNKQEFNYSNISAFLAGAVVSCAVGEDLYTYLGRKLFTPLGIINPPYARSDDGYFYGASSMELSVHELSKIGLLLYNGGVFNGERLLSEEYIKEAVSVQQMNREGGYGYFVWKYRNGFSINGKWKQKCYVLPEERVIITFLSHIEEENPFLIKSMEKNILDIKKG